MGTNYYVRTAPCENPCAHCNAPQEIHLGKSSAGWPFSFRAYREIADTGRSEIGPVADDYASWLRLLDLGPIFDEVGLEFTRAELVDLIESKRGAFRKGSDSAVSFHDADGNHFTAADFC